MGEDVAQKRVFSQPGIFLFAKCHAFFWKTCNPRSDYEHDVFHQIGLGDVNQVLGLFGLRSCFSENRVFHDFVEELTPGRQWITSFSSSQGPRLEGERTATKRQKPSLFESKSCRFSRQIFGRTEAESKDRSKQGRWSFFHFCTFSHHSHSAHQGASYNQDLRKLGDMDNIPWNS